MVWGGISSWNDPTLHYNGNLTSTCYQDDTIQVHISSSAGTNIVLQQNTRPHIELLLIFCTAVSCVSNIILKNRYKI